MQVTVGEGELWYSMCLGLLAFVDILRWNGITIFQQSSSVSIKVSCLIIYSFPLDVCEATKLLKVGA